MLKKLLLILPLLLICSGSTLAQGTATETAPAKTAEPAKKPAVFRSTKRPGLGSSDLTENKKILRR
ncbi:MAG: hypothetical protein IPG22_04535 [Acidobacteria bacterium]|nr:hypothetical protein [Acidobacteriota bacterium]